MVTLAALTLLAAPPTLTPRVAGVSLFKNGYAVVTREVTVGEPGSYLITQLPQGALGTVWLYSDDGVKLATVETTNSEKSTEIPASSLDDLLRANIGKTVTLGILAPDGKVVQRVLKIVAATGSIVIVEGEATTAILKTSIVSIEAGKGELKLSNPQSSSERVIRVETTGKAGRISIVSLERGLTWAPAYAVDITDPKKLKLIAKATLLNDLEDLNNIEAKLITGFPNVPYARMIDPLVSGYSVEAFLQMVSGSGGSLNRSITFVNADPRILTQNAAPAAMGGGAEFNPGESMPVSGLPGEQLEDLFFYRQPNVTLKKGQRSYQVLFQTETPYDEVYTWDNEDSVINNVDYRPAPPQAVAEDVWHALTFKNNSGQPLTTAVATTFQQGQILGQDTLKYTSRGSEAEVRITKALDVRAEAIEEEVSRERGTIKRTGDGYPIFDLVTLKGTLSVTNLKSKSVALRIKKSFTGDFVSATGNPKLTKANKGIREMNPTGQLVWTTNLEPGKNLNLTYTYKVYFRTPN